MAGCHSKLSDKKFQNWIKASYAGNIAKEGLEDIVLTRIDEFHRDILTDIVTEENLDDGAKCYECKTENLLPCPTRDICALKSGSCSFHNCKRNYVRACPNKICDRIRDKIKKSHRFCKPSWKNTRADAWCSNPVEIAKCYLPREGYLGVNMITEMDLNGILNVMTNHQAFEEIFDLNACIQAKELGKQFRHSSDLLIGSKDLNEYLASLIMLLTSSNLTKKDAKSIEAVQKIRKLKAEALSISTKDVTELLQSSIQEMTLSSLRDIAEKAKQCMEDALLEIRASVSSGIELFTEATKAGTKRKNISNLTDHFAVKRMTTFPSSEPEHAPVSPNIVKQYPGQYMPSPFKCLMQHQYEELRERLMEDLIAFNCNRHTNIPISPLFEKFDAALLDFYVLPDMNSIELKKSKLGGSEIKYPINSLPELFRQQSLPCQEIYLAADAGLGKTSFSKYLTLSWCHAHRTFERCDGSPAEDDMTFMQNFDFVFLIPLRESRDNCDIDDMLFMLIIKQMSRSYMFSIEFLQEVLHREKCLIILDGLDEWAHPEKRSCQIVPKCIPHRKARERCTILTTSRPWKLSTMSVCKSQIHHLVEIVGLSKKAKDVLKGRAVSKVKIDGNDALGGDIVDFNQKIRENEIYDLETIPMLLMYLVCLWCEGKPLGRSKCELFSSIVDLKLSRNKHRIENLNLSQLAQWFEGSEDKIPLCIISKSNCKRYLSVLKALGDLAFNTLFGVRKEDAVVFDISVAESFMSEEHLHFSFCAGILTQTEVPGYLTTVRSNVSFTHKTFQEFFAALHIASTSDDATMVSKLLSACSSIHEILDFSNAFVFLSGISPRRSELISSKLTEVVTRDEITYKYRSTESFWDYLSVEEPLKRFQDMEISCVKEHSLNFDGTLNLRLEDFIIDRDCQQRKYASALEALAVTNIQEMKSLNIELEGIESLPHIMNSFGLHEVRGIEHVLLRGDCTEDDVIHLVSKSVDTLKSVAVISRKWESDHFEGQLCLWSHKLGDTLIGMSKLEAVHLNGFYVGHNHLKELVSYLNRRNTMKEIILGNIICVDHLGECKGFEINLTSHSLLRTLRLHNLPLSQLKINVSSLEQVSIGQLPYSHSSVLTSYLRCLPAAKHLERFRCSFLESARDVEEVLKTLPSLINLKDLRLHEIDLGERTLSLSNKMENIEFVHLSEVTMSSSAFQKLMKTLMGYRQSVMVVLVNCELGIEEDIEMIRRSIRTNKKLMVLFDGENQWKNNEFSFRTVNDSSEIRKGWTI